MHTFSGAAPTNIPNLIQDGGFESPNVGPNASQYSPTQTPWTFSATAGIAANGSGFTIQNPNAPQGIRSVFIQFQFANISQNITLTAFI